ncbi:MAG: response regulator [Nitrosomonadales bacterium]|nr:response regulator [Nitrosomonadales bacterium]
MIRLLIANNHPAVCEGLKQISARASDIEIAGETENGEETLQQVHDGAFDLLLLCMNMQDVSGVNLIGIILPNWRFGCK